MHIILSLAVQGGVSPLYMASKNGHTEIVDLLVRAGADVNQANKVRIVLVPLVSVCHMCTYTMSCSLAHNLDTLLSVVVRIYMYIHS